MAQLAQAQEPTAQAPTDGSAVSTDIAPIAIALPPGSHSGTGRQFAPRDSGGPVNGPPITSTSSAMNATAGAYALTVGKAAVDSAPGADPHQPSVAQVVTVGTPPVAPIANAPSTAPAAPVPTPVYQQLAAPILSLRVKGDGSHSMTINLHPADLGPVTIEVRLRDGQLSVALAGGNVQAQDALRAAMPQLHQELTQAGLTDLQLSLGSDSGPAGFGAGSPGGSWTGTGNSAASANGERTNTARTTEIAAETMPTRRLTSASGIDRWL